MKKKLALLMTFIILTLSLVGCGTIYQEATYESAGQDFCGGYFTIITQWGNGKGIYRIVYANDTKVKYMTISSKYQFGITPLYNADGTLQVYDGE